MLRFEVDDLSLPQVRDLLIGHLREMREASPPESYHALDLDGFADDAVTLWTAWEDDDLVGCGALRQITSLHGEIKSMRTLPQARGSGVGSAVLAHLLYQARRRGYRRVSLETGSQDVFAPARRLYVRNGFQECPPFGGYVPDPNSVFMTLAL